MPLFTTIHAGIAAVLEGAAIAGIAPTWSKMAGPILLANGSGDFQADKLQASLRTLASATTEDIDIRGAAVDPLGNAANMTVLKALEIISSPDNTTDLTIGGDANSVPFLGAVGHTIVIKPGGRLIWVAPKTGVTVTAGTGDIIQVANGSGASATYLFCAVGI